MIKQSLISIIIGAALIYGLHFFMNIFWVTEASVDIIIGSIIDFFIFSLLLNMWNVRNERVWKKELDAHLDKIELLLKRAYASIKEIDGK